MIPAKEEGNVVSEMKLEEGCVVHVMGKPAAGGGSNDAAAPAGATPAGATVNLGSAAASSASSSSTTVTAALARLAMSGGDTYRTALTTADKVLGNIVKNVSLFFPCTSPIGRGRPSPLSRRFSMSRLSHFACNDVKHYVEN